jgi:DNA repair protein RadC
MLLGQTATACSVPYRGQVFSLALQEHAVKIVRYHNHPSGELPPRFSNESIIQKLISWEKTRFQQERIYLPKNDNDL